MKMKANIEEFIAERTDELLNGLFRQNTLCYANECLIQRHENELREMLDSKAISVLNSLLNALSLKSTVEAQYLYCQGLKDAVSISCLLDTEATSKNFYKGEDDIE